jgi:hypothetical protein
MVVQLAPYVESDLDGREAGGFVVVNVDAAMPNSHQVLEDADRGYFRTLAEARDACERFRDESGNNEIYIYALVGVQNALETYPADFRLS